MELPPERRSFNSPEFFGGVPAAPLEPCFVGTVGNEVNRGFGEVSHHLGISGKLDRL